MEEHGVVMNERADMEVRGVKNVTAFDEEMIILDTNMGPLSIRGDGLHIVTLTLNEGRVAVRGHIDALEYHAADADIKAKGRNFLKRILK
jgi:sporulation protein YabP